MQYQRFTLLLFIIVIVKYILWNIFDEKKGNIDKKRRRC